MIVSKKLNKTKRSHPYFKSNEVHSKISQYFGNAAVKFIPKGKKKNQRKEEIWARAGPSSGPGCHQAHSGCRLTAPSCFFTSRDLLGEGEGGGGGHLARDSCAVLGYGAATVPSSAGTDLALSVSPRGDAHCVRHLLRHTFAQRG